MGVKFKQLVRGACMVLLMALTQCGPDNGPAPETSLMTVGPYPNAVDINVTSTEAWIITQDSDGKALSYQQLDANAPTTVSTGALFSGKLTATILEQVIVPGYTYYNLTTYTDIDPGEIWNVVRPVVVNTASPGAQKGVFFVDVTNTSASSSATMTDRYGITGDQGFDGVQTYNIIGPIFENAPAHFLFATTASGNPRYEIIDNPKDQASYNFDVNTMKTYDHVVPVALVDESHTEVSVNAFEPGWPHVSGYKINYFLPNFHRSSVEIGYLDRFEKFETTIASFLSDEIAMSYSKVGTRPTSIILPLTTKFDITDKNITSFKSAPNPGAVPQRRHSQWFKSIQEVPTTTVISWDVHSPSLVQTLAPLPDEILKKYPKLTVTGLNHYYSEFIYDKVDYATFLDTSLKGETAAVFEVYKYIRYR